jgi:hypothetical protein
MSDEDSILKTLAQYGQLFDSKRRDELAKIFSS